MKNTNKQLITDLFFEYGITINICAIRFSTKKGTEELRKYAIKDAERFLNVVNSRSHRLVIMSPETLVDSFFEKCMRVGMVNAGKRGWRDEA